MKTSVAKTGKTQCTAFGHRDKRRCRLERRDGELTCHIHKNYYKHWYERHRLFDRYQMSNREVEELEFQIQNHYVNIPANWITQLYTPGERAWYSFVMDNTDLSPVLNLECFQSLFYNTFFYNTVWNNADYIRSYVRDVESCMFAFTMILQWSMQMSHGGIYSCLDLASVYVDKLDWKPILYSTQCMDVLKMLEPQIRSTFPQIEEDIEDPTHPFVLFIRTFLNRIARPIKKRCALYKEDLIAAVLSPRRIQRLLDMGYDFDVLDHV
jgi:hypothetical protein